MLMARQRQVTPQRGMPVDDKGASSSVIDFSESAAVQLYYYSGSTRTADAGQAAGTAVVGQFTYDNIKNVSGAYQATHNDTSLAFTSTALTTEVAFPDSSEGLDGSTEKEKLDHIAAKLSNGEYCVDYSTGAIYGKKTSTTTTLTAVSYKIKQNRAGDSASGGGSAASASGGGLATYYAKPSGTNADATSAYASATTLTVTGLPHTFTQFDIQSIDRFDSAGAYQASYEPKSDSITVSGTTITLSGATFASGDQFVVTFALPPKTIEPTTDTQRNYQANPQPSRRLDKVPILSAAQNFTASWADLGTEIPTAGYRTLYIWATLDINDTQNPRIKFLPKHTSAGSEEYKLDHNKVECPATTVSAVAGSEDSYLEFDNDQDDLYCIKVPLDNSIPFIQTQIEAGTVGASAGQIDALYYTLGY